MIELDQTLRRIETTKTIETTETIEATETFKGTEASREDKMGTHMEDHRFT
jgi:hypothetical protein